jgi:hypothetical protein
MFEPKGDEVTRDKREFDRNFDIKLGRAKFDEILI